jgi:membrane protease YdiL (CAAX protease family)
MARIDMIAKTLDKMARESNAEMRWPSGLKPFTRRQYLIGLTVIFMAAYSQYLIPGLNPITGALIVYGTSIVTVSVLCGARIVRRTFRRTALALKLGLALFGIFALLGTILTAVVFYAMLAFDPSAANLLNKPIPLLNVPPHLAWIMVWVSFLVVGPAEEYIFRGFVYGGLLNLFKGRHWFFLAFISSILFALVHLYYALVYGIASIIPFIDVAAAGMALAITYYIGREPSHTSALIHGAYDASGFLGVAVSPVVGLTARGLLTFAGLVLAVILVRDHWTKVVNG